MVDKNVKTWAVNRKVKAMMKRERKSHGYILAVTTVTVVVVEHSTSVQDIARYIIHFLFTT